MHGNWIAGFGEAYCPLSSSMWSPFRSVECGWLGSSEYTRSGSNGFYVIDWNITTHKYISNPSDLYVDCVQLAKLLDGQSVHVETGAVRRLQCGSSEGKYTDRCHRKLASRLRRVRLRLRLQLTWGSHEPNITFTKGSRKVHVRFM